MWLQMNLTTFTSNLRDYKKIFVHDNNPKKHMYDAGYAERMRQFSARPLWQEEARFAMDGVGLPSDARALDIGCNNGGGTEFLSQLLGIAFDGVDASEAGIQTARNSHPGTANRYQHYDGRILPFEDNSFDLVCSMHVVGHVASPHDFLREMYRVTKPGGFLRLITPNADYKLFAIVDSLVGNYHPDPTVRQYFFRKSLTEIVQTAGFVDVISETFGERPLLLRRFPENAYGKIRIVIKARKAGN